MSTFQMLCVFVYYCISKMEMKGERRKEKGERKVRVLDVSSLLEDEINMNYFLSQRSTESELFNLNHHIFFSVCARLPNSFCTMLSRIAAQLISSPRSL